MRKKKKIFVIVSSILLLFVILFSLSNIFLLSPFYGNSWRLRANRNREIKSLVLSAIKDRYSYLNVDIENMYDEKNADKNVQFYSPNTKKSILCLINHQFMDTLSYNNDTDTYTVIVKMYYPEERYHEFIIANTSYGYTIISWGIDI